MLKSCGKCGRIHDKKYICCKRVTEYREKTRNSQFRSTAAWTNKSIEIRERDKYLCQVCLRGLHGSDKRYTYQELEVHHIIPLSEDWDRRLDNDNLITLCKAHHEMAENETIGREELMEILREQKRPPQGSGWNFLKCSRLRMAKGR